MSTVQLSVNSISELLRDEKPTRPVVQISEAKLLKQPEGRPMKYKGYISDGKHITGCIFTSELSAKIAEETVRVNAAIRLTNYIVQKMNQVKTVVIMKMDLVEQLEV